MSIHPVQAIADIWKWEMKTYDEIMPNHKISMPMLYNHAVRVLDRLNRRLSRITTPAQPLKYKYEINRLAHKLEELEERYNIGIVSSIKTSSASCVYFLHKVFTSSKSEGFRTI